MVANGVFPRFTMASEIAADNIATGDNAIYKWWMQYLRHIAGQATWFRFRGRCGWYHLRGGALRRPVTAVFKSRDVDGVL